MSYTSRLMAFVKDHPYCWIPAQAFEQFGRQAWRTRISEARKKFEAVHDGTIENRQRRTSSGAVMSEYRWVPEAVGRLDRDRFDANAPREGRLV